MVALDGVVLCAIDDCNRHGAAGCGQVDVLGALPPSGAGCAGQGVCDQCAVFVVDVAHAGFLGGGCGFATDFATNSV